MVRQHRAFCVCRTKKSIWKKITIKDGIQWRITFILCWTDYCISFAFYENKDYNHATAVYCTYRTLSEWNLRIEPKTIAHDICNIYKKLSIKKNKTLVHSRTDTKKWRHENSPHTKKIFTIFGTIHKKCAYAGEYVFRQYVDVGRGWDSYYRFCLQNLVTKENKKHYLADLIPCRSSTIDRKKLVRKCGE